MKIENGQKIKITKSLSIEAIEEKSFNKLHVENLDGNISEDFFFTHDGKFDFFGPKGPPKSHVITTLEDIPEE